MSLILETDRLILREMARDDAGFILELVNDPDWLRHIGDRNIRDLADACQYIENGPRNSYRAQGFGLWAVILKGSATAIGLCGFLKRDTLEEADLGYAFLPAYRKRGYGLESCRGALNYAASSLGLSHVLAIVSPKNGRSIVLLKRLGFSFLRSFSFVPDDPDSHLYRLALDKNAFDRPDTAN